MKYFYMKFLRQTQWRVVSCSLLFYYIFFFICFTSLSLCCCCWTVVVVGNFLLYKNIQTISQSVNMTTVASILTWEHRHFFVDREIYAQKRTDGQGDGGREKDKILNMYEGKDDDGTTKKKKSLRVASHMVRIRVTSYETINCDNAVSTVRVRALVCVSAAAHSNRVIRNFQLRFFVLVLAQ